MKLFFAAFVMVATVSFVSCSKDDDEKNDYPASTSYTIHYQDGVLTPGQTVVHTVTAEERANGEALEAFFFENKTANALQTRYKVELVEGPESMSDVPVCYGECRVVKCPFNSDVFSLAPGVDSKEFSIHCYPDMHQAGSKGTYKITVGKTGSMEDPQVFFLQFVL